MNRLKIKLGLILMMSDGQAKQNQQNAQKIKYSIQMINKSLQHDVKSLNIQDNTFKKRNKPKNVSFGLNIKVTILTCLCCMLAGNFFALIWSFSQFQVVKNEFSTKKFQGQQIISSYSYLCSLTNQIDHTGIMNFAGITYIIGVLNNIQMFKQKLAFSQSTNQVINHYFFQDSCQMLTQKGVFLDSQGLTCQNATPGYEIYNPYNIGLDLYFRRLHYNIINNFQDTFSATGIYSISFIRVYKQLSKLIFNDQTKYLEDSRSTFRYVNIFVIALNLSYCLLTLFISYYLKQKQESIQKFVKYLQLKANQTIIEKSAKNQNDKKASRKKSQSEIKIQRHRLSSIVEAE